MAVFDCVTYNGERAMLEIRLNILDKYVDRFIIVEAKTTFSGNKKPLYFSAQEQYFKKWWHKIDYFIIDENYTDEEIALAESSPNTIGASHWRREFMQKESIHKALEKLDDEDTVYIGDVDEIWQPVKVKYPSKLKLLVYAYYLNNLSNEEFWGTLVAKYGDIRGTCLNHVRSNTKIRSEDYHGYHFTSMGGVKEVRRKLNDSYTSESYNTEQVQQLLSVRVSSGVDYLGRPFTFTVNESQWPEYLKKNREQYKHLCL